MIIGIIKFFLKLAWRLAILAGIFVFLMLYALRSCYPDEKPKNQITEIVQAYNRCEKAHYGDWCTCPICHSTFKKGELNFCCSEHEKEYWTIVGAWNGLENTKKITNDIKQKIESYDY